MNKTEILKKVDEIVEYIKNSEEYQNYLKASEILSHETKLLEAIEDIKKYQQAIVKDNTRKKELEKKIQEKENILNNSIVYTEFLNYQNEVNNMLVIFENKLNKYFEDMFN